MLSSYLVLLLLLDFGTRKFVLFFCNPLPHCAFLAFTWWSMLHLKCYQCFSDSVGKMQKPLPELLKEFDLPVGIFPRDATNYEFNEETKKLIVYIPSICEVGYKDSSVLRFSTSVTGYLEKGKLTDIEGLKTKVMIWVKVTCITSEGSKLHVMAGLKKTRSREAYEVLRDGVSVEKFWKLSKLLLFVIIAVTPFCDLVSPHIYCYNMTRMLEIVCCV